MSDIETRLAQIEENARAAANYNYGMRRADELAHEDVPWLLNLAHRQKAVLDAVEELHTARWECGDPQHTNPDVGCPYCVETCDVCEVEWPCPTVRAIREAMEGESDE